MCCLTLTLTFILALTITLTLTLALTLTLTLTLTLILTRCPSTCCAGTTAREGRAARTLPSGARGGRAWSSPCLSWRASRSC